MSVLDLPTVKAYLGKVQNVDDAALPLFIEAAEAAIVNVCGPLVSTATTSVVEGSGQDMLTVPVLPIISVTSLTGESGTTVTPERVSGRAGVIYAESALSEDYYTVVYNAGWAADAASLPGDLKLAVCELVRHLWMTQRGTAQRGPDSVPGAAYAFPNRVTQLLSPYMSPGFA